MKNKIEVTEMDAIRRLARISRIDRITNEGRKKRMSIEGTRKDDIKRKQLICYKCVNRMKDDRETETCRAKE